MSNEWKDLTSFEDVANAMLANDEIQVLMENERWYAWAGTSWFTDNKYRSRPRLKMVAYIDNNGWLYLCVDGHPGVEAAKRNDWLRVPSEDKFVLVER